MKAAGMDETPTLKEVWEDHPTYMKMYVHHKRLEDEFAIANAAFRMRFMIDLTRRERDDRNS